MLYLFFKYFSFHYLIIHQKLLSMKNDHFEKFQSKKLSPEQVKAISGGDVNSCMNACTSMPCPAGKVPTVHCCYQHCTGQPLAQDCLNHQPMPWCWYFG